MCYALQDAFERESEPDSRKAPEKLTEVNQRALECFIQKHNSVYQQDEAKRKEYLDCKFRDPVEQTLKKLVKVPKKELDEKKLKFTEREISRNQEKSVMKN